MLDQNISRKLVDQLKDLYPGTNHVYLLGLHEASDKNIWYCAKKNGFTIVTQDSDFSERSLVFGYPPKVIWLRMGNVSTKNIEELLKKHRKDILLFGKDKSLGCLQIF